MVSTGSPAPGDVAGASIGKTTQRVGWRELVTLPDLCGRRIPAKIDTGARTSSLHATEIESFDKDGHHWLRFLLDIGDGQSEPVTLEVKRADRRTVTSSNGEGQERHIIKTMMQLGASSFPVEFSLADRSEMQFPILVGRTALRRRFLVDSGRSYLQSAPDERAAILNLRST
ncbi:ATP-dependent zinc protease family protein [Alteripontixanthobacter maritimus]|uniref:ATP-dependent zinc protease family protein n=1 Tax=Alteripontixanthobacter maritimus TaxID=2161824 RepID=UPI001E350EC0|nr:RimK/LysX family protein [Alteripontixanthobacter maritimus]